MDHFDNIAADPEQAGHIPVLLAEVLSGLALQPGMLVIDGTLGGGGHTAVMLTETAPTGRLLGIDADPAAIRRVALKLTEAVTSGRLMLAQGNFGNLATLALQQGFTAVDAILLDLGLSSFQLETGERGFAFGQDGPLDMRFDPTQGVSADEIVNQWPEHELADLIYQYGEERLSRKIARYLVQHRPLTTTSALAAAVEQSVGGRKGSRIHPATRTFQALRIAVNEELTQLERVLPQALQLLKPGGRLAVISFHSLEDRIVKQWMQQEALTFVPNKLLPQGGYARAAQLEIITRKPLVASDQEMAANLRSRSAKLRIAQKL